MSKHVIIDRVYLPEETLSSFYVFSNDDKGLTDKLEFSGKGLEPPKNKDIRGVACIAESTYWVHKELTSPHHNYPHFRVENVPGHTGILWHIGNYEHDTLDCYLVGDSFGDRNKDGTLDVLNSKTTLQKLWDLLPDRFQVTYREKPKS